MSAKYIKTDSWTYVNPSPSSPSTRLVYFYERYTVLKRFDPFFRSSSRILTTSKLKEGCSLFLFLSLFLRILRKLRELSHAAVPIRGTALLTLFSRINLGISRPNLFVSRANIFQRLFYESLADRDFCNRVSCTCSNRKN